MVGFLLFVSSLLVLSSLFAVAGTICYDTNCVMFSTMSYALSKTEVMPMMARIASATGP
jgi:hypothetical protein